MVVLTEIATKIATKVLMPTCNSRLGSLLVAMTGLGHNKSTLLATPHSAHSDLSDPDLSRERCEKRP